MTINKLRKITPLLFIVYKYLGLIFFYFIRIFLVRLGHF